MPRDNWREARDHGKYDQEAYKRQLERDQADERVFHNLVKQLEEAKARKKKMMVEQERKRKQKNRKKRRRKR